MNRLRALALAGGFALAATLALALPAAAKTTTAPPSTPNLCVGAACLPGSTPTGEAPPGPGQLSAGTRALGRAFRAL